MGLITGEFSHPTLDNVSITVDKKGPDEEREPWQIVSLDTDFAEIRTPEELRQLGSWLVVQAAVIEQTFNSNGSKKRKS